MKKLSFRIVAACVAAVVTAIAIVAISNDSGDGLNAAAPFMSRNDLAPGRYTVVDQDAQIVAVVLWTSNEAFYAEEINGEFVEHLHRDGNVLTRWTTGNIVDLAGAGYTDQEIDNMSDAEFDRVIAEIGYGTVPRTEDFEGVLAPHSAIMAPAWSGGEAVTGRRLVVNRNTERQFTATGIPTSVRFLSSDGNEQTFSVQLDPTFAPVGEQQSDYIRRSELGSGNALPSALCLTLTERAQDVADEFPRPGCP